MSFKKNIKKLNKAIRDKNIKKVRKIISKNPELLKDNEKIYKLKYEDPLETALIEDACLECIKLLLENGSRLRGGVWNSINSPLEIALGKSNDRKEIIQLLLKYDPDTDYRNCFKDNLLTIFVDEWLLATDEDAAGIAEMLLDAGVPIDEPGGSGEYYYSPLERSIKIGNYKLTYFLISRGAAVRGSEVLQVAAINNKVEDIDFLLSKGAEINDTGRLGFTALCQACSCQHEKMISALLKRGADINVETDEGDTPFCELTEVIRDDNSLEKCIVVMVKEFSRLSFENHFISANNIDLIRSDIPKAQEHFDKCKKELSEMANTIFYTPYSFYSIFKKSIKMKKLGNLAKNEDLVKQFETNLQRFFYFKSDLQTIWEKAIKIRNEADAVFDRLSLVFHDYLPEVVIEILTKNLTLNDLPSE